MPLNTRTCEICHTQVPLDKCKLFAKDINRNLLVCEVCCTQLKAQHQAKIGKEFIITKRAPNATELVENIKKSEIGPIKKRAYTGSRDSYFCSRCRYNFTTNSERTGTYYNLCCPYCGKGDRLERRS